MKHSICCVLITMMVLVSTSLVFSGGEQEIEKGNMEGRTLDILYFVGGMGQMPDPVIEKLEEKYPGLEVKIEYNQRAEDIIRNRMMANDAPDIFCINANRYSYYGAISEGLLGSVEYILNTETENNSTIRDLFLPGVLQELGYVEGTNYLLPQALYYGGFWYDDTLLKKYNVEPPETWDDFLIACEKFKEEGIYGLGYLGQAAQEYLVNYFYMPMLRTVDPKVYARVMNLDPNAWETQAVRELFERIVYIRDMGYIEPNSPSGHIEIQMKLINREIAFYPCGSWLYAEMEGNWKEDSILKFIPVPSKINNEQKNSISTIHIPIAVNPDSKNKDLIAEFFKMQFSNEDVLYKTVESFNVVIPLKNFSSEYGNLLAKPVVNCIESAESDDTIIFTNPWSQWYPNLPKTLGDSINALVTNRITVDEAVERMTKATKQVIDDETIPKYSYGQ